ncbi:MAG: flavodoxin family protein [Spirochaetota bacterium]
MSSKVVYYSIYGNCRFVAEELAGRLDTEAIELVEARGPRKGLGILWGVMKALRNKGSRLAGNPWNHIRDVDTVWLVTPIWASRATPAANAFLDGAHLAGKTVNLITLQADPEGKDSDRVHGQLSDRVAKAGGKVGKAIPLHSAGPGDFAGETSLTRQVERITKARNE